MPELLNSKVVAKTNIFEVERMEIRFSSGEVRTYERLKSGPMPGVMVVPMLDSKTIVMIREYFGGIDRYLLSLPKGAIEEGETSAMAANRELQEEAGYKANKLTIPPA